MPFGGYGKTTLYDLFAPLSVGEMGYEPYEQQYGTNTGAFVSPDWGANQQTPDFTGPAQPQNSSVLDSIANKFVGTDRYQDLSEQARRRALGQGMMSLGQSLLQAGLAPDYRGVGQALAGAIPNAMGTFENSLSREDKMRQDRGDEEYQKSQREFQKKSNAHAEQDWKDEDAQRAADFSAAKDVIGQQLGLVEKWVSKNPEAAKSPKAEALLSDLKAKVSAVQKGYQVSGKFNQAQLGSIGSSVEKLSDIFGEKEALHDAAGKAMYMEAVKSGFVDKDGVADVAAWAKSVQEQRGVKLDADRLRRAKLEADRVREEDKSRAAEDVRNNPSKYPGWEVNPATLQVVKKPVGRDSGTRLSPAEKLSKEMERETAANGGALTSIVQSFQSDPKKPVDTRTALALAPYQIPGVEVGKPLPETFVSYILSTVGNQQSESSVPSTSVMNPQQVAAAVAVARATIPAAKNLSDADIEARLRADGKIH